MLVPNPDKGAGLAAGRAFSRKIKANNKSTKMWIYENSENARASFVDDAQPNRRRVVSNKKRLPF